MKIYFLSFATILCLSVALFPLYAQSGDGGGRRLGFLSADDRAHFLKVREQVLSSNPDLKSEQESLDKEKQFVKGKGADASADDRKTLRENMQAHHEKMRAAMIQADPSISPVLDQIDAKMKERFQQHAGQDGASGN